MNIKTETKAILAKLNSIQGKLNEIYLEVNELDNDINPAHSCHCGLCKYSKSLTISCLKEVARQLDKTIRCQKYNKNEWFDIETPLNF